MPAGTEREKQGHGTGGRHQEPSSPPPPARTGATARQAEMGTLSGGDDALALPGSGASDVLQLALQPPPELRRRRSRRGPGSAGPAAPQGPHRRHPPHPGAPPRTWEADPAAQSPLINHGLITDQCPLAAGVPPPAGRGGHWDSSGGWKGFGSSFRRQSECLEERSVPRGLGTAEPGDM